MPPQAHPAAGFRYTPSSYLLRSRDENRPWSSSDEDVDSSLEGEHEDMAMRQEDRPTRKGTSIDQHFQNRVNRRKQAYRRIIQGEVDVEADDKPVDGEEVDLHLVDSPEDPTPPTPVLAGNAREARQRRLSASTPSAIVTGETILSRQEAEKAMARNLRAERLRHSLRASSEEEDAKEALKLRRLQQAEQNRLALEQEELVRKREEEALLQAEKRKKEFEEERRKLAMERKAFEEAKCKAAEEAERKREAEAKRKREELERLHRQKELERQRELDRRQELDLRERETRRLEMESASEEGDSRQRASRKEEDENDPVDLTLFEEFQEIMRDSGVLKICVMSCFGDERDVMNGDDDLQVRTYHRKRNEV